VIDYRTVLGPLWQQYGTARSKYTAAHIDSARLEQTTDQLATTITKSLNSLEETAASGDATAQDRGPTVRMEIDELDANTWLDEAKNDILLHQIFLKRLHEQIGLRIRVLSKRRPILQLRLELQHRLLRPPFQTTAASQARPPTWGCGSQMNPSSPTRSRCCTQQLAPHNLSRFVER
jgi:hypothetical protein